MNITQCTVAHNVRWPTMPKSCLSALLLCFSPKLLCHLAVFIVLPPPPQLLSLLRFVMPRSYVVFVSSLHSTKMFLAGCIRYSVEVAHFPPRVARLRHTLFGRNKHNKGGMTQHSGDGHTKAGRGIIKCGVKQYSGERHTQTGGVMI